MTDENVVAVAAHPAKFADKILAEMRVLLHEYLQSHPTKSLPLKGLDPFAGVGKVYALARPGLLDMEGVEIEAPWALNDPRTIIGDSKKLNEMFKPKSFDLIITSPTYGTRMADHHEAKEVCRACGGSGEITWYEAEYIGRWNGDYRNRVVECPKCDGKGIRNHFRNTYRHVLERALGKIRPLTEGNSGMMQWGPKYWDLHEIVWQHVFDLGNDDAELWLNISDHIRNFKVVEVTKWHKETCQRIGWEFVKQVDVKTPRNRQGENWEARVEFEHILVFKKAS